jgi:probable phosphoglycerate mutase
LKLYITRHGETEWNKAGKMQGWQNSDLTEKGIENAKKLGESLKSIEFDRIYCSPLGRALETAKHIRGSKATEIIIKDSLKEMGFGCWEGVDHEEVERTYPEQKHNFWNKPHLYEPVDGESYQQLIERVGKLLDEIIRDESFGNILIVTHAAVKKAIYKVLRDIPMEDFWGPPYMYDTCLTVLEITNGEIKWLLEADTSHLDQQPSEL